MTRNADAIAQEAKERTSLQDWYTLETKRREMEKRGVPADEGACPESRQEVADRMFREEMDRITLRAWPPLTPYEKLWQVGRLQALVASRAAQVGA